MSGPDDILSEPLPFGPDNRNDTQLDMDFQRFLVERLHKPTTGMPGARVEGQDLAPKFTLYVTNAGADNRIELRQDLTQYIESVEFESAVDMADMFEMTISNPNFMFAGPGEVPMADALSFKPFQPGNEVELWGGYGHADTFIGRAVLTKHFPQFPQDGVPKLTVKGYAKSYLMMKASGDLQVQNNKVQLKEGETVDPGAELNPQSAVAKKQLKANKGKDMKAAEGEVYINMTPSDVVQRIADKWGFDAIIEDVPTRLVSKHRDGIIPKKGLSDYEIVKALANLYRREFFVDYDTRKRNWVLHWESPSDNPNETPLYTFKYAPQTKDGSLLTYEGEYAIKDQVSSVVVLAWDPHPPDGTEGRWISAIEVTDVEGEGRQWHYGGGREERMQASKAPNPPDTVLGGAKKKKNPKKQDSTTIRNKKIAAENRDYISHALKSATEFRLAAGGFAIDMMADKPFENPQDLADYATRWFLARRDAFIVAKGTLVGVETVRAGQVHEFLGLGEFLSGLYYFVAAKHKFSSDSGYTIDYIARKILES